MIQCNYIRVHYTMINLLLKARRSSVVYKSGSNQIRSQIHMISEPLNEDLVPLSLTL